MFNFICVIRVFFENPYPNYNRYFIRTSVLLTNSLMAEYWLADFLWKTKLLLNIFLHAEVSHARYVSDGGKQIHASILNINTLRNLSKPTVCPVKPKTGSNGLWFLCFTENKPSLFWLNTCTYKVLMFE